MKTTFIRQIIAIAIFSASILCTSGTPLPASLRMLRDVLPSLPIDAQLVKTNADPVESLKEPLLEVTSTESNVPHEFLIAPRGPIPLAEVIENTQNKFSDLISRVPPASEDPVRLEKLLEMTVKMYDGSVHQREIYRGTNPSKLEMLDSLDRLVHRAVTISSDQLFYALRDGIAMTERQRARIITLFIRIAQRSISYPRTTSAHEDWAVHILERVNWIMGLEIHSPTVQESQHQLQPTQAHLENREEERRSRNRQG